MSRDLTINDLCQISGYSRHQMRGLLDVLPIQGNRSGGARVANTYTGLDLLLVVVCCKLETKYGLKRQVVGEVASRLVPALSGPSRVAPQARLVVTFDPVDVIYVEEANVAVPDGLVVALEPVFALVDAHLAPARSGSGKRQHEFNFGLLGVASDSGRKR